MTILSAIGVSLISVAIAGYIVSLIRPHANRPEHDEHEDY